MGTFQAVINKTNHEQMHSMWLVNGSEARWCGGLSFKGRLVNGVSMQPGEDLLAALDRVTQAWPNAPHFKFKEDYALEDPWIQPGGYYPRMAVHSEQARDSLDKNAVALSLVSLASLVEQLKRLFGVVHPMPNNFGVYGAEIRSLLILCCTEVEAQWKGVLKAHDYVPIKKRPTTEDYVKLLRPMHLDEYEVILPLYPWLETIKPYHGWDAAAATKSLPWYDAYNEVKHDREGQFAQASLGNVIKALCGMALPEILTLLL